MDEVEFTENSVDCREVPIDEGACGHAGNQDRTKYLNTGQTVKSPRPG